MSLSSVVCQVQSPNAMDSLWNITGTEMLVQKNYIAAEFHLKEIAILAKESGDDGNWAFANVYIAYCILRGEKIEEAKDYLELVRNQKDSLDLTEADASGLMLDTGFLLGKYYYQKGWYEQAGGYFQETIDRLLELSGKNKEGKMKISSLQNYFSMNPIDLFNDAALTYYKFGDYQKSLEFYDVSIRLSEFNKGMRKWKNSRELSNMGLVQLELGNLEEAIKTIQKSKSVLGDPDEKYGKETLSLLHKNTAYYYQILQKQDSCKLFIDQALALNPKDEFKVKIYHVYMKSLMTNASENKLIEAFDSLYTITERSLGYYHPDMAKNFQLKGNAFSLKGKHDESQVFYNNAINILQGKKGNNCNCNKLEIGDLNDKRLALDIIYDKAKALSFSNQNEEAIVCYRFLQNLIIELHQKYIISEESKFFLAKNNKKIYEDAIQASISVGDLESAYSFSQASRSMILLQQVQDKNAMQASTMPEQVNREGLQFKLKINEYQKRREEAILNHDFKDEERWNGALFEQNKLYENWINDLEKKYPIYFNLKYNLPKKSISDLKKHLKKNNATMIEYFMGDKHLYTFVLNVDELKINVISFNENLEGDINNMVRITSEPNFEWNAFVEYHNSAYVLFSQLLEQPINKGWIKNKNLYIVPDEQLYLISFDALLTLPYQSNIKEVLYHKLDYLIKEYNISYLYSSNFLGSCQKNNKGGDFLGIAPSFEKRDIIALNNNQSEVRGINEFYNGKILLGSNANYKSFGEEIENCNIAHFATHAIFNDEIPMDSRIELADTSLYIYDIFSLSHQLQLAVISACQTASGKQKKGEGVVSLSRAFVQSGCPSVLASLWDVSDQKAIQILVEYHKNLIKEKQHKNESLANAKKKFLSNALSMDTHPYFWAGYIQIGDTSPLIVFSWGKWIFGLVVFLFTFFICFLFLKKKSS